MLVYFPTAKQKPGSAQRHYFFLSLWIKTPTMRYGRHTHFSGIERSGTEEKCAAPRSGGLLLCGDPLSALHWWQSHGIAGIYPDPVVVDESVISGFTDVQRFAHSLDRVLAFTFQDNGSCYRVRNGLTPPSYYPCRAHHQKSRRDFYPIGIVCCPSFLTLLLRSLLFRNCKDLSSIFSFLSESIVL